MLDRLVRREIAEALSYERAFSTLFGVDQCSDNQNKSGGYDFTLEIKIELKKAKWLSREDSKKGLPPDYQYVILELKNNVGGEGWLYKRADWFMFELESEYLAAKRTEIVNLVDSLDLEMSPTLDLYKMYRREGRNDLTTVVLTSDIEALESSFRMPRPDIKVF
jgi:hypothetical protein